MSAPRILAQIVMIGGGILGRAFVEAWKQAGRNIRAGEGALGGSAAGAAGGGISANDTVSRRYGMTIDEACNILNVNRELAQQAAQGSAAAEREAMLKELLDNYEKMMKMNEKTSHYIQSKIVRAKERIDAELPTMANKAAAAEASQGTATASSTTAPPPPPGGSA